YNLLYLLVRWLRQRRRDLNLLLKHHKYLFLKVGYFYLELIELICLKLSLSLRSSHNSVQLVVFLLDDNGYLFNLSSLESVAIVSYLGMERISSDLRVTDNLSCFFLG